MGFSREVVSSAAVCAPAGASVALVAPAPAPAAVAVAAVVVVAVGDCRFLALRGSPVHRGSLSAAVRSPASVRSAVASEQKGHSVAVATGSKPYSALARSAVATVLRPALAVACSAVATEPTPTALASLLVLTASQAIPVAVRRDVPADVRQQ